MSDPTQQLAEADARAAAELAAAQAVAALAVAQEDERDVWVAMDGTDEDLKAAEGKVAVA